MSDSDAPPPIFDPTVFVMSQLGYHIGFRFADALAPLGIGPRHFGTLRFLHAYDGLSQHQLCTALDIHRNVMVGLVDDLEARGMAERRRHPEDRRAHAVHLLPAGEKMLREGEAIVAKLDADFHRALTPTEQATLRTLLEKAAIGVGLTPGVHPGFRRDGAQSC